MFDRIISPISLQIERFEQRLDQALDSDVERVQSMSDHLLETRGKRFRPALSLLTAQAIGDCSDKVIEASVGIELIHLATLIHDDVIDLAETRHGTEVLNFRWGDHSAVLMGDFLLAKALEVLVNLNSMEVMVASTRATRRMIEGEIMEIQRGADAESTSYFHMIDKKTASLMALACEVGAILGGGTPEQIAQMFSFGKEVGIAFQITDDLLDFIGDAKSLGKPVGNDVREKKVTLPLIRALANCQNGEAEQIQAKVRNGIDSNEDFRQVIHFVRRYGGIEEAREEARTYAKAALKNLDPLRSSDAREALELAVQHVVNREH